MMTLRTSWRLLPSNKTLYPTHMVASVMVTAASPSRPVEVLLSVSLALLNPLSAASTGLAINKEERTGQSYSFLVPPGGREWVTRRVSRHWGSAGMPVLAWRYR